MEVYSLEKTQVRAGEVVVNAQLVSLKKMWNVPCPVYSNVRSRRLVSQQSECLDNEGKPDQDVNKEQGSREDVQEDLPPSAIH